MTWGTGGEIALTVGLALISVVLMATFVGSVLPIVLNRLRLDPAVISAPFITTFVDGSWSTSASLACCSGSEADGCHLATAEGRFRDGS